MFSWFIAGWPGTPSSSPVRNLPKSHVTFNMSSLTTHIHLSIFHTLNETWPWILINSSFKFTHWVRGRNVTIPMAPWWESNCLSMNRGKSLVMADHIIVLIRWLWECSFSAELGLINSVHRWSKGRIVSRRHVLVCFSRDIGRSYITLQDSLAKQGKWVIVKLK